MRNLRLDFCYDGTRYRGFQRQPDTDSTIQGKLEKTLSQILEEPIEVIGSGRTDAGVHAKGQVANFHCKSTMPSADILNQLRRYLPEDIGIYSCKEVSERFHARYNAQSKTYCYRIWNSEMPCVFDRRFVTVMKEPLNVAKMQTAANYFVGEHDFASFCGKKNMKKSTIREIYSFKVEKAGSEIRLSVNGNGFLFNMVRLLVGTLVEVGSGERTPESVRSLFREERAEVGHLMPPQGLCLMEVFY